VGGGVSITYSGSLPSSRKRWTPLSSQARDHFSSAGALSKWGPSAAGSSGSKGIHFSWNTDAHGR
jgi:hypothetical protein